MPTGILPGMPWIVVSENFAKDEESKSVAALAPKITLTASGKFRLNPGAQTVFRLAPGTRVVVYRGDAKDAGKVLLAWLKGKEGEPKGAGVHALAKDGSSNALAFSSANLRYIIKLPKGESRTWDLKPMDDGGAAWFRIREGAPGKSAAQSKKATKKASK